jgi:hypothetical protein
MRMLPSGLSEAIEDDENLARFLTSSSQFNAVMVKPSAFLPNPTDGETSVFRHGSEPRDNSGRLDESTPLATEPCMELLFSRHIMSGRRCWRLSRASLLPGMRALCAGHGSKTILQCRKLIKRSARRCSPNTPSWFY